MKFILCKSKATIDYWNGTKPLPNEINVLSYSQQMAEFELIGVICTLHGFIHAYDVITGADQRTEKDKDINAIMTAFEMYLYPKMPLSGYSGSSEKRIARGTHITNKVAPVMDDKIDTT